MAKNVYSILKDAFECSNYMHSAGSGDEQRISNLLAELEGMDEDESLSLLQGGIAAVAMISVWDARDFAEQLLRDDSEDLQDILDALTERVTGELFDNYGDFHLVEQNEMVFILALTNAGLPSEPFQLTFKDGRITVNDGDQFVWDSEFETLEKFVS